MIVQGLTGVDDPDDRTGTTNVDDDPASDADEPTRLGSHEGPVEAMALS